MKAFGSLSDLLLKSRAITLWGVMASGIVSLVYVGAYEFPSYWRRSELQSRVYRGRISLPFSPYAHAQTSFHTRSWVPKSVSSLLSEDWVFPLEPMTSASLVPRSDDDVRKLAPEVELERVSIIALDGQCTDQLLRHLVALPNFQSLDLCNVLLTDRGIDLLLRMPQLRNLHIECAADQSPGLNRLSELVQIERIGLTDMRCPVSNEVYRQIAGLPRLRELRLCGTELTAGHWQVIAGSQSLENICFIYTDGKLTLQHARILAALPKIRSVEVSDGQLEPDAQEYLEQRRLIPEELLLSLPRL